ncbi:MAG: anion transporter [Candidatus Micrarchaeota archaeon]|nr:anion transporter [Candidatus Micrarchaeota archaeon]
MGMGLPPLSVIVLVIAFVLITFRRIGNIRLQIWQIVLGGALAVMITGQVSPYEAASYIDLTVITFLLGIFIVGEALTESGYAQYLSYKIFKVASSVDELVLLVLLVMGFASMFLLNDTIAVIVTPVVMIFAMRWRINPNLLLLSLAFAITIGSVASPIGNPQNLIVASSGLVKDPFVAFFSYLLVPTAINLAIAYLVLKAFYRKEFHREPLIHTRPPLKDKKLAGLCKLSLAIMAISVIIYATVEVTDVPVSLSFSYIAVMAALPILIFSNKRLSLVANIDWRTIIFFMALFVLVGSVWQSGFLQNLIGSANLNLGSVPTILLVNVLGSQLVSNVPMVLIYLKLLAYAHVSTAEAMALAAGSTIAGNLFVFGAASNIIIIQIAERKYDHVLSFVDFAKVGIVVTSLNVIVCWIFLAV